MTPTQMPNENQIPQPNIPPEQLYRQPGAYEHKKNWFAFHHIVAYVLFGLLGLAIVAGAYYYQVSQYQPDITPPAHHPKQVVNDSNTWKTYTNNQFGFEFKYPSYWILQTDPDGVGFAAEGADSAHPTPPPLVISFDGTKFTDIVRWANNQYPDRNEKNIQTTQIAGQDAVRIEDLLIMGAFYEYAFIKNGILFRFKFNSVSDGETNQILSTFKFIDSGKQCAQVVTPATNNSTGEYREFPTPCDVPAGWTVVNISMN